MLRSLFIWCALLIAAPLAAQTELTPADWQADLQYLSRTVHADYPFLFRKVTAEEFDRHVAELHAAIPNLQTHQILAGFARIVSSFQYGHTRVALEQSKFRYHALPLNLYQFRDGVFVQATVRENGDLLGAEVLKIEGVPIDKAMGAIRPLVPAENDQFFKAHGLPYLCIPEALHAQGITSELKSSIRLTLRRDGKEFDRVIEARAGHGFVNEYGFAQQSGEWIDARDQQATPLYLKHLDKRYYYEYLPESKAVFVRHSAIQDEPNQPIPDFYREVFEFIEANDVDRLVIDVRLNSGGNNYKNKPIVQGLIRCDKINVPGKLFVIIGRRTFSACQNLVNELDSYTNAIFVGEPTAENVNFYGDTRRVELPNSKVPVQLSFAWWQDKPQWENADWLAPDVFADMSFAEFQQNRDPALEAVLAFDNRNLILDPLSHLRQMFEADKPTEEIRAAAREFASDPRYKFVQLEQHLNEAGYGLMRGGRMREAQFVFELNTELYPQSANVWDSLGEYWWTEKQTDKAIEYYTKALELDPTGQTGQNAKQMLEKIRQASQPGLADGE